MCVGGEGKRGREGGEEGEGGGGEGGGGGTNKEHLGKTAVIINYLAL